MAHTEAGPSSSSPSPSPEPVILVIEDEPGYRTILDVALSARGYEVLLVGDGASALRAVNERNVDLTVLDLGLPDVDGVELCRHLRRFLRTPIVVVTADGAEDRKVSALDEGADDYVTKPFSMPELLARVRAQLRHRQMVAGLADEGLFRLGPLAIDTGAHEARLDGAPLALTRKEFALLELFARNAGRVLTHRQLLTQVWGSGGSIDTLRTHVTRLRSKLGDEPGGPRIEVHPGVGYRLRVDG